jgi:hypothetical protein
MGRGPDPTFTETARQQIRTLALPGQALTSSAHAVRIERFRNTRADVIARFVRRPLSDRAGGALRSALGEDRWAG